MCQYINECLARLCKSTDISDYGSLWLLLFHIQSQSPLPSDPILVLDFRCWTQACSRHLVYVFLFVHREEHPLSSFITSSLSEENRWQTQRSFITQRMDLNLTHGILWLLCLGSEGSVFLTLRAVTCSWGKFKQPHETSRLGCGYGASPVTKATSSQECGFSFPFTE